MKSANKQLKTQFKDINIDDIEVNKKFYCYILLIIIEYAR